MEQAERERTKMNNQDNLTEQIRAAANVGKGNMGTALVVWEDLTIKKKLGFGFKWLLQTVKLVLQNPTQFRLLIDGEPIPLSRIDDKELLRYRIKKWRKQARSLNARADKAEAYLLQLEDGEDGEEEND